MSNQTHGSTWIVCTDLLPNLGEIVWLYDAAGKVGPWIGSREDSGEGWQWCRSYGSEWWSQATGRWDADAEDTDDTPTHWYPLPTPPNGERKPTATAPDGELR